MKPPLYFKFRPRYHKMSDRLLRAIIKRGSNQPDSRLEAALVMGQRKNFCELVELMTDPEASPATTAACYEVLMIRRFYFNQ